MNTSIYSCFVLLLGCLALGCAPTPDSPVFYSTSRHLKPLMLGVDPAPAKAPYRNLDPRSYTYFPTHWQPLSATAEGWAGEHEIVIEEINSVHPAESQQPDPAAPAQPPLTQPNNGIPLPPPAQTNPNLPAPNGESQLNWMHRQPTYPDASAGGQFPQPQPGLNVPSYPASNLEDLDQSTLHVRESAQNWPPQNYPARPVVYESAQFPVAQDPTNFQIYRLPQIIGVSN